MRVIFRGSLVRHHTDHPDTMHSGLSRPVARHDRISRDALRDNYRTIFLRTGFVPETLIASGLPERDSETMSP